MPPEAASAAALTDRRRPTLRTTLELLPTLAFACVLAYHHFVVGPTDALYGDWVPSRMDWLFGYSLLLLAQFGVYPLVANPRLTRERWQRFRTSKLAVAALAWTVLFVTVALVAPLLMDVPEPNIFHINQPPVFASIDNTLLSNCVGTVANGQCHGTWQYPLGTQQSGKGVLGYVVYGARESFEIGLTTATLVVLIGTTVGVTAAYAGGWTDELLMRYVDVQQAIPAVFVYLAVLAVYSLNPIYLVVVFGLLSWGGIARIVRSEALKVREEEYIQATENAGAGPVYAIRKHVLPNVSSTVVTTASLQLPFFIVVEATMGYLGYSDVDVVSWGVLINEGLNAGTLETMWWVATVPAAAIALTVVSINVVGDQLRDALDPRD